MLKKIIFATLLGILFIPLLTTTGNLANAAQPPITSPITAPVTSPISIFNLTGHVTYEQLGRLLSNMHRFTDAVGVFIEVHEIFHPNQKFHTLTDSNGMYSFNLQPGLYEVIASDGHHTLFIPPLNFKNVTSHGHATADFQGLLPFRF